MLDPIFNINDLLLIITIAASLVLALVQPVLPAKKRDNRLLLAGFFLSLAISNTGVMLIWNEYIHSPLWATRVIPYIFSAAMLVKGPVLYLYVRSITDTQFCWSKRNLWHLVAVFCAWPLLAWYGIDLMSMRFENAFATSEQKFATNVVWQSLRIIPLAYFIAATVHIYRYHRQLESQFSHVDTRSVTWLYWLTISFVIAGVWSLAVAVQYHFLALPIGITENYVSFILMVALCYYSLSHAQDVTATSDHEEQPATESTAVKPLENITKQILQGVEQDKLYLNPTLNIDQFSRSIGASSRDVSYAINKVFGKNFFEFINFYRIEAAKRMLEDPEHARLTVIEILMEAGFNSKSSFQRFFKRFTGVSPTEYRERHNGARNQA